MNHIKTFESKWPDYTSLEDIAKYLKEDTTIDVKEDDRKNAIRYTITKVPSFPFLIPSE